MANQTPWPIRDRWTTASGFRVVLYENGVYECNATLYPTKCDLQDAIGSLQQ